MKMFYGLDDLGSVGDALRVTERLRKANTPGLYGRVLRDACRIRTCMNFTGFNVAADFLTPVAPVAHYADPASIDHLQHIATEIGGLFPTLDAYVGAVESCFRTAQRNGTRGIKLETAYRRDLAFSSVPTAEAERVYGRIFEESRGTRRSVLGFEETRPLQDYMVHRMIEMAGKLDLPVVFHTGLQAGNRNDLNAARPERLWNLLFRYRNVTFILLHAGIPWTDEAGMMAKYFPNAYIDMAWMHIISPRIARQALATWIDMVPRNKILGFGGDLVVVEKVYGHLAMAKQNIAAVLASSVADGRMTEGEAQAWAASMLRDTPSRVYGIS
jgi:hypothetical protein